MRGRRVLCVGEVLVDMVPRSTGAGYGARVGGAPANVAVALSYLGNTVSLAARIGRDWLGELISETLGAHGLGVEHLQRDAERPTTIAVVAPPGEEPDFLIYLAGTAGAELEFCGAVLDSIRAADLVHVGSLLLASPTGQTTCSRIVTAAREAGSVVSTDLNLRPTAWSSQLDMVQATRCLALSADVVKATKDEIEELALDTSDGRLWLVTDGPGPAVIQYGDVSARRTPVAQRVVDTTGAGDATFAVLLDSYLGLLDSGETITHEWAAGALERALLAGQIVVSHVGAMDALPSLADLRRSRRATT